MTIRQAAAEDADGIAAIWNDLIDHSAITFTTQRKTPEGLRQDIAARGAAFLVAEREAAIIGYSTYFPFRSGPGYAWTMEYSIALCPEARGQGMGRALVQDLETVARAAGIHSLIGGVSGENPDGVAFHQRMGFRQIARLPEVGFKFGRWMDLVLMQKML